MGLSFLTPLFAIGFAAIAVPLLVHLVHREKKDTTPFPSLAFLRKVPYRHSSRRRLRDVLLFALRIAVLSLLTVAFARPVLARIRPAAAASGGGKELVILVDRSFSMRYGDRWVRAVRAARDAIDRAGAQDLVTVVPFDLTAQAVNEPTGDHGLLRAAMDSIRTVDAGTRLAPALGVARRIMAGSRRGQREVVVVSDFQRSAFDLTDESRLPAGVVVTPIDVGDGDVVDQSVRSVELRRVPGPREQLAVHARLGNMGPAVRGIQLQLRVAGRTLETRVTDLPADGGGSVDFAPIPVSETPQPAEVRIRSDALAGDDRFAFVLARASVVSVLVANPPDLPPEGDVFLRRVLEIGDRPPFELQVKSAASVTADDVARPNVVILNDAWLPSAIMPRLVKRVSDGGGLLVVTGPRAEVHDRPGSADLLAGPIVAPADRQGERGAVLGYLDASHPALSLFAASRSGDLSAARFFRYRPIAATSGVLARYDDGSVALAERRVGRGRVLQFGSSLDGYWNDLPRQPVFLPFIHQLMRYAAAYRDRRDAYLVGEAVGPDRSISTTAPNDSARTPLVATSPSGRRIRFGGPGEPSALLPAEAGVFEIRRAGSPGERPRLVAVNIDPRELEFSRFDPLRLTEAVRSPSDTQVAADSSSTASVRDQEREQSLWWYILWVASAALVLEALLARRTSAGRASAT